MHMLVYTAKRLLLLIPLLLGVTFVVFLLTRVVIEGNPVDRFVPPMASAEERAQIAADHGLDQPVTTQYLTYVQNLAQGDLGISFNTSRPVTDDLSRLFPATFELTTLAMLLGLLVGIPLGVIAGVKRDSWVDHLSRALSVAGVAMPVFWLSLLAIYFLFYQWGIVPAPIGRIDPQVSPPPHVTGLFTIDSLLAGQWDTFYGTARILFLPVVVLAFGAMAPIARMTRSGMVDALDSQYVLAARALGIPWRTIVLRYALKNALLPAITMTAVVYGFLLGGSVLVENIFAFPGLGRYAYNAISGSDYPAIQGFILYAATMYVSLFLITDIIYRILDPRIETA